MQTFITHKTKAKCSAKSHNLFDRGKIFPKLIIGPPNDVYEQEADAMAEKVMTMPETGTVQRKCAKCEEEDRMQRQSDEEEEDMMQSGAMIRRQEEEEEEMLQSSREDRQQQTIIQAKGYDGMQAPPKLQQSLSVSKGNGSPLPDHVNRSMSRAFGNDFSHVRVHTNHQAALMNNSIGARAFTHGPDIYFKTGQYSPGTYEGKKLLAHELTHVVQQTGKIGRKSDNYSGKSLYGPDSLNKIGSIDIPPLISGNLSTIVQPGSGVLQRLGDNPGCTDDQEKLIHQAIYNARGWLNKAISQLNESPLSSRTLSALRRNFGPTYGVAANSSLIRDRLRVAYRELSSIPISCSAGDADCPGPCGHAFAGSHAATICNDPTLEAGTDWRYQAGCVLHESLHAAFSKFTVDEYSGWHGQSGSTPTYPGQGTDPLLNADSYTTLAMDLS